jgi:tRNA pseudouridine38-40 synthase
MRNLKRTIAYGGADFHGWQIQPSLRTIQGMLQDALHQLFNHEASP